MARTWGEILRCVPQRAVQATADGELMVLLRPRYLRGPLAWWLQPRLRNPYFKVHLDPLGTFVWNHCDGQVTVEEIINQMEAQFHGEEQLQQRVVYFLRELERGQMVRLGSADAVEQPW